MSEKVTPLQSEQIKNKIKNGEVKVGKKSVIQAEGKAHHEDTAKADKKVEKAKPKTETPKEVFPADGKINKYGFLHFSKEIYEALGWAQHEDIAVKITRTANGITIERA